MSDDIDRLFDISKDEMMKGGDYYTRIIQMPIYRRLAKDYENLDDVIRTAEVKLFKDDPVGFFIEVAWKSMVKERASLQQIDKGAAPIMGLPTEEAPRVLGYLYFFHKDIVSTQDCKTLNIRIYEYCKERIRTMREEHDKRYLEDELQAIAKGQWDIHPNFEPAKIAWLLEMYAKEKVDRYVFSRGRDNFIALIEHSRNVVILEV